MQDSTPSIQIETQVPERSVWADRWKSTRKTLRRLWRKHPMLYVGVFFLSIMVLMAILAPFLNTVDPIKVAPANRLLPPSGDHWFGTDFVGRDVWSRAVYGARNSLSIGAAVALASAASAGIIGLFAGYSRKFDEVIMRIMDALMSIPNILLAIALVSIAGGSIPNVIGAITLTVAPRAVRVIRSQVLSLKEAVYVDAARAIGAKTSRIVFLHVFPGTIAPMIVTATIIGAGAIVVEAVLSFLGAGPPPEIPSWGTMMADGRRTISQAMWVVGFPGMFLTITVLSVNIIGDNLRDILDPKLRRSG
ncbi:MAG: ABC transporter permease [SAR202 cluster bacterium]|nr:ABC transporter permease [SAR202 cluster bacterium]